MVSYIGRHLERFSTGTWERTLESTTDPSFVDALALVFVGFVDESTFLATGQFLDAGGGLFWVDSQTLQVDAARSRSRITEGSIKSQALSPGSSRAAVGSSDGFVRVFDAQTGDIRHELRFGKSEIQGLAFVNERHLIVAPQGGSLQTVTLDLDELRDIVRKSLVRGFTPFECERFGFGDECPTLVELSGG